MIIRFHQITRGGCGLYCLANFFDNSQFICNPSDLEEGQTLWDMNNKLREIESDWYLNPIFCTSYSFKKQPNRLLDEEIFAIDQTKLTEDARVNQAVPFLFTVRLPVHHHYILVLQNLKDDLIYVFDSRKKERVVYSQRDFIEKYVIVGVERFCNINLPKENKDANIVKGYFPHLFAEGE